MRNRFTLVALMVALGACSKSSTTKAAAPESKQASEAVKAQKVDGIEGRRIDIEVGKEAYKPNSVSVKANEQITLVFTRTTDETCGTEVKIPSLHIEKPLPLNQPVAISIKPDKTGEIGFACGMDMMRGKLVVTD